ncbi:sulfatase-like hydrolase/transferase [Flavilitoribacter nigricans]|uniref:Sulfatase N-terminal domain-containing protein n=1 Tax=Flavilitoribacter nigricans (strain ATCC 23147 / DSM 23189 / NBRC 102662 / NCIMB 1420 / SS-2) TaxID=1122177 RepID=A0A2D0N0W6_FLAN2|nr:sulfatase-like hydrolase/transferase [Flavilitoribacter nigricans]PHN02135.1 hypothetical protein CRP01_33640 [Flavilitoribacter nigricans DSM 23189 = NBRC 102662]
MKRLFTLFILSWILPTGLQGQGETMTTSEIRIRDPFILTDTSTGTYYMYAQMHNRQDDADAPQGVEVYTSRDLKNWTPPRTVLRLPAGWRSVWAPEVHAYRGKYYLFVTLTSEEKITENPNSRNGETQWQRGTHVFRADSPTGPFTALRDAAHTPAEWMSLDGTLFTENDRPYMVFCHEWAQTLDGTMDVVELRPDLSDPVGEPRLLFRASEAPWVRNMQDVGIKRNGLVTDGPAFYRNKKGALIMIWSSFGDHQYAIGQAISRSGSVFGPWEQIAEPLVRANGGHGMFFRDLDGQLQLAFHQPNGGGKERLHLAPVRENDEGLLELKRPNIVFIFSDDLSFRDLSAYGQLNYRTPNLDALLRESTRFTQAYAGAPECAPSRATMLTGLHVGRAPIRLNSSARGFEPLPADSYTFAEMLQKAGYRTGVVGKWGLGYKDTAGRPTRQGFDYHFGYLTHYEAHSYFPLQLYENGREVPLPQNAGHHIQMLYDKQRSRQQSDYELLYDTTGKLVKLDNRADAKKTDRKGAVYAPDLLDEKALQFITDNREQPFLLYYTTNLPHGPTIVDDLRQMTGQREKQLTAREWGAMVERLDISVGKIVRKLKEEGLYERTAIVFASDNGYSMHGPVAQADGSRVWLDDRDLANKGPFRGGKFGVLEGGMRIPFFIHLPGQEGAQMVSTPVWLPDLFPTFEALAGTEVSDTLDGYDLLPVLAGDQDAIPADRLMYFYKQNEQALRQGPWFVYRDHPDQPVQLYLPEEDQTLSVNLADFYPNEAATFKAKLDTIHTPHPWYWNPGDTAEQFEAKKQRAEDTGQVIKRYRPNGLELMPWERR